MTLINKLKLKKIFIIKVFSTDIHWLKIYIIQYIILNSAVNKM